MQREDWRSSTPTYELWGEHFRLPTSFNFIVIALIEVLTCFAGTYMYILVVLTYFMCT